MTTPSNIDTIVAIATAPGAGGVGIVRLSGPRARGIAEAIGVRTMQPRQAHYARFRDALGEVIDDGIALWFPAPHSFTGEAVVELQGHGSPVVLQQLVARCIALGARQARPGEFSERAFLNGKLDLAQAEAIADLIAASDTRAARAARRSLDGVFSRRVDEVAEQLVLLRIHVEAAIDFADEPLDTLGGEQVHAGLGQALRALEQLRDDAERGRKLRDGLHAVLVGPPNAGKSSLLNALAGSERAIVTDIAGTTRDTLRETIRIDGLELTLVDTAGLRDGGDAIEREGMRRAHAELERADLAIVVLDAREVGFIDSTGLRAIIAAGNRLTERDGHLMIEGMSGAVQTVLEISGLIDRYRTTTTSDSPDPPVDPIDAEAAHIDARSEDAAAEIGELIEHARELGRDAPAEVDPDAVQN